MTDDLDVILEKHANLFENTRVPSSIKEAFELLMKNDYVNEIVILNPFMKQNRKINYVVRTPYERYPEFKNYNSLFSHPYVQDYVSFIDDIVSIINESIKKYNESRGEDRESLKVEINAKSKNLQLIINTIKE